MAKGQRAFLLPQQKIITKIILRPTTALRPTTVLRLTVLRLTTMLRPITTGGITIPKRLSVRFVLFTVASFSYLSILSS